MKFFIALIASLLITLNLKNNISTPHKLIDVHAKQIENNLKIKTKFNQIISPTIEPTIQIKQDEKQEINNPPESFALFQAAIDVFCSKNQGNEEKIAENHNVKIEDINAFLHKIESKTLPQDELDYFEASTSTCR